MAKKDSKSKRSFVERIKDSGKEFVEGVKEEIDEATKSTSPGKSRSTYFEQKRNEIRETVTKRVSDTSTPEELYYSTTAWFWAMIFVIIICLSLFFYGFMAPRFFLVGLLALIAMPILIVWCLIHMIPTIQIFGFTVFDRRQLSLRRQLSVGKEIARFFTREFLEESPVFAFLIFIFMLLFLLSLTSALIP